MDVHFTNAVIPELCVKFDCVSEDNVKCSFQMLEPAPRVNVPGLLALPVNKADSYIPTSFIRIT